MMNLQTLSLALTSIALSGTAQLAFKKGMLGIHADAGGLQRWFAIAGNVWVLGGFALYFLSAALWLLVLKKADVSVAYPLVSVGFVITLIGGSVFFGESITPWKLAGVVLVGVGLVMIAAPR